MNGGIPSRRLLNAGNIPFDLQEKIGLEIEAYSVFPLLDGEVSGSGTLVNIDGVRGILTARHVVRKWQTSRQKDQRVKCLGIVPGRRASNLVEEPLEHFDSFVTARGVSETLGPDMAFVRIPSPSGFLSALVARKSFFDLNGPAVRNRTVAITRTSPLACCGIVDEKTEQISGRITLNQYVIFGTEPQVFEKDGYDYVDLRSRRSLKPDCPISFGGVSGSGLWRFSLAKLSDSEVKPIDFQVAGVAFYELGGPEDEVITIRFHGPRSIYEHFLPQVRDWLAKK